MNQRKEAMALAREIREEFRTGDFDQLEFRAALDKRLRAFRSSAYGVFVDKIAEDLDREYLAKVRVDHHQKSFLPDEFDGDLALGDNKRVPFRLANIQHLDKWLAIDAANAARIIEASARKLNFVASLRPYMTRLSVTVPQAAKAYRRDHPEEKAG